MKTASVVLSLVVAVVALVAVESASAQGFGYQFGRSNSSNSYQPTYRQPCQSCQPGMHGCQAGCLHNCPPGMNCSHGMNGAPGMNRPAQSAMNPGYGMPRQYGYPGMQPRQPQYGAGMMQPSYGQGFGPGFTR